MKRLSIVIAITLCSGALILVVARNDVKKFAKTFFTKAETSTLATPSTRALHPASTYNVNLSTARVSKMNDGRVVVMMEAKGDLQGSLTLTLERDGAGT